MSRRGAVLRTVILIVALATPTLIYLLVCGARADCCDPTPALDGGRR